MLAEAAEAAIYLSDYEQAVATSRRAAELGATGGIEELITDMTLAAGLVGIGEIDTGSDLLARGLQVVETDRDLALDPRAAGWALNAHAFRDDLPAALQAAKAAVALTRARSAIGDLPYVLEYLSHFQLYTGHWPEAYATGLEAATTAHETGQASDEILSLWGIAIIEAARGNAAECRRHAEKAAAIASKTGSLQEWAPFALGFLELSLGQPGQAIQWLEPAVRLRLGQAQHCPVMAAFDLIEAYTRAGDRQKAKDALDHVTHGYAGRPWEQAGILRCTGLVDDESKVLWEHLKAQGYIDAKRQGAGRAAQGAEGRDADRAGAVQRAARRRSARFCASWPAAWRSRTPTSARQVRPRQAVLHSAEFKALWDRIKHKTTYRVQFDNEKLVETASRRCATRRRSPRRGCNGARPTSPSARRAWRRRNAEVPRPSCWTRPTSSCPTS